MLASVVEMFSLSILMPGDFVVVVGFEFVGRGARLLDDHSIS
jgi:S-adenosylhomocysteine hydrolase